MRIWFALLLTACGSSNRGSSEATAPGPSATQIEAQRRNEERAERAQIVARHRVLESEQQDALGQTCTEPKPWNKHERCLPSCYTTEPADPRAGMKLAGKTESQHLVCQLADGDQLGPPMLRDQLAPKLRVAKAKRFPRPHGKQSWQGELEAWFRDSQRTKLPRTDVVVVVDAKRREVRDPLTQETLRCVTIAHYSKSRRGKLGDCGAEAGTTCEAVGNGAARGINVVHYRLAEAKRLQRDGDTAGCEQAALEAVAVARGLPRWRQYAKLNVGAWKEGLAYRTRFDGVLDEDTLFMTAATLGREAEALYVECAARPPRTTAAQEQSFHTCW